MKLPGCTLVVPTRNRADEMRVTVGHLLRAGLADTPAIVVDDASDDPSATAAALSGLTDCALVRQPSRTGQAEARNEGLRRATSPFCLFLDDDAHIEDAAPLMDFLAGGPDPDVGLWRFETIRSYDGYRDGIPADTPAMPLHTFIGFGVLMNREAVLRVGGYRGFLRYRYEEDDLAARLFRAGLPIRYQPGVRFIHRHTATARSSAEYEFLSSRNVFLLHAMNWPWPGGLLRGLAGAAAVIVRRRRFPRATVRGLLDGMVTLARHRRERTPMSRRQAAAYRALQDRVLSLRNRGPVP